MSYRLATDVLLLAVFIVGCGDEVENVPTGTWIGQTAGNAGPRSFREIWTFTEGQITTEHGATYTYQVDATKEPKQIDIAQHVPGRGDKVQRGIYKIEEDTLTICHLIASRAKADAKRPEEFYPTERNDVMTLTFQRKK